MGRPLPRKVLACVLASSLLPVQGLIGVSRAFAAPAPDADEPCAPPTGDGHVEVKPLGRAAAALLVPLDPKDAKRLSRRQACATNAVLHEQYLHPVREALAEWFSDLRPEKSFSSQERKASLDARKSFFRAQLLGRFKEGPAQPWGALRARFSDTAREISELDGALDQLDELWNGRRKGEARARELCEAVARALTGKTPTEEELRFYAARHALRSPNVAASDKTRTQQASVVRMDAFFDGRTALRPDIAPAPIQRTPPAPTPSDDARQTQRTPSTAQEPRAARVTPEAAQALREMLDGFSTDAISLVRRLPAGTTKPALAKHESQWQMEAAKLLERWRQLRPERAEGPAQASFERAQELASLLAALRDRRKDRRFNAKHWTPALMNGFVGADGRLGAIGKAVVQEGEAQRQGALDSAALLKDFNGLKLSGNQEADLKALDAFFTGGRLLALSSDEVPQELRDWAAARRRDAEEEGLRAEGRTPPSRDELLGTREAYERLLRWRRNRSLPGVRAKTFEGRQTRLRALERTVAEEAARYLGCAGEEKAAASMNAAQVRSFCASARQGRWEAAVTAIGPFLNRLPAGARMRDLQAATRRLRDALEDASPEALSQLRAAGVDVDGILQRGGDQEIRQYLQLAYELTQAVRAAGGGEEDQASFDRALADYMASSQPDADAAIKAESRALLAVLPASGEGLAADKIPAIAGVLDILVNPDFVTRGLARRLVALVAQPRAKLTADGRALLAAWHGDGVPGSASYQASYAGQLSAAAGQYDVWSRETRFDMAVQQRFRENAALLRRAVEKPDDAEELLEALRLAFIPVFDERALRAALPPAAPSSDDDERRRDELAAIVLVEQFGLLDKSFGSAEAAAKDPAIRRVLRDKLVAALRKAAGDGGEAGVLERHRTYQLLSGTSLEFTRRVERLQAKSQELLARGASGAALAELRRLSEAAKNYEKLETAAWGTRLTPSGRALPDLQADAAKLFASAQATLYFPGRVPKGGFSLSGCLIGRCDRGMLTALNNVTIKAPAVPTLDAETQAGIKADTGQTIVGLRDIDTGRVVRGRCTKGSNLEVVKGGCVRKSSRRISIGDQDGDGKDEYGVSTSVFVPGRGSFSYLQSGGRLVGWDNGRGQSWYATAGGSAYNVTGNGRKTTIFANASGTSMSEDMRVVFFRLQSGRYEFVKERWAERAPDGGIVANNEKTLEKDIFVTRRQVVSNPDLLADAMSRIGRGFDFFGAKRYEAPFIASLRLTPSQYLGALRDGRFARAPGADIARAPNCSGSREAQRDCIQRLAAGVGDFDGELTAFGREISQIDAEIARVCPDARCYNSRVIGPEVAPLLRRKAALTELLELRRDAITAVYMACVDEPGCGGFSVRKDASTRGGIVLNALQRGPYDFMTGRASYRPLTFVAIPDLPVGDKRTEAIEASISEAGASPEELQAARQGRLTLAIGRLFDGGAIGGVGAPVFQLTGPTSGRFVEATGNGFYRFRTIGFAPGQVTREMGGPWANEYLEGLTLDGRPTAATIKTGRGWGLDSYAPLVKEYGQNYLLQTEMVKANPWMRVPIKFAGAGVEALLDPMNVLFVIPVAGQYVAGARKFQMAYKAFDKVNKGLSVYFKAQAALTVMDAGYTLYANDFSLRAWEDASSKLGSLALPVGFSVASRAVRQRYGPSFLRPLDGRMRADDVDVVTGEITAQPQGTLAPAGDYGNASRVIYSEPRKLDVGQRIELSLDAPSRVVIGRTEFVVETKGPLITLNYSEGGAAKSVPLQRGRTYELGRQVGNDIVVNDGQIGRQQLSLQVPFDGPVVLIEKGQTNQSSVEKGRASFEIGEAAGENGHIIAGGVSTGRGGGGREILIVDWSKDAALGAFYERVLAGAGIQGGPGSLSGAQKGALVQRVFDSIRSNVVGGAEGVKQADFLASKYMDQQVLIGDAAIVPGKGVCRHMGILQAAILERLIQQGFLSGKVFYDRGPGHGWARYRTSGGKEYILDAMQKSAIVPIEGSAYGNGAADFQYGAYKSPLEPVAPRPVVQEPPFSGAELNRFVARDEVLRQFGTDPRLVDGVRLGGISGGAEMVTLRGETWVRKEWRGQDSEIRAQNELFGRRLVRKLFPEFDTPDALVYVDVAGGITRSVVLTRYLDGVRQDKSRFTSLDQGLRTKLAILMNVFGFGDVNYQNVLFGGGKPVLVDFESIGRGSPLELNALFAKAFSNMRHDPHISHKGDNDLSLFLAENGLWVKRLKDAGLRAELADMMKSSGLSPPEAARYFEVIEKNLANFETNIRLQIDAAGGKTPSPAMPALKGTNSPLPSVVKVSLKDPSQLKAFTELQALSAEAFAGRYSKYKDLDDPKALRFSTEELRRLKPSERLGFLENKGMSAKSILASLSPTDALGVQSAPVPGLGGAALDALLLPMLKPYRDNQGFTIAGQAFDKHSSRKGSALPALKGNRQDKNVLAERALRDVLASPHTLTPRNTANYGPVVDYRPLDPGKPGVRLTADGRFVYFIDPPKNVP